MRSPTCTPKDWIPIYNAGIRQGRCVLYQSNNDKERDKVWIGLSPTPDIGYRESLASPPAFVTLLKI
jgi:hypothetical protein